MALKISQKQKNEENSRRVNIKSLGLTFTYTVTVYYIMVFYGCTREIVAEQIFTIKYRIY